MDQEKTYKWIQDRLRDLRSGTLSENDRVQLFELAKDDPFIQDAIEGYQSAVHHDHTPNLRYISHRIQNKSVAKRRKLLPDKRGWVIQAVAASLVLVLVTWAVIYYIGQDNQTSVLVATEPPTMEGQDLPTRTDVADDDSRDIAAEERAAEDLNKEPSGLRANAQSKAEKALSDTDEPVDLAVNGARTEENKDQSLSESVPPPAAAPSSTTVPEKDVVMETYSLETQGTKAGMESTDKKDEGYYANQMNPALMRQRITGQVIDPYGQPIPGAFIAIENSNLISTSNIYGQFELFLPDQTSKVNVSSTGYIDTAITVSQGNEDLVVMLLQDLSYDKDVPTNAAQSKAMTQSSTGQLNNPVTLTEYLKSNSRFPIAEQYTSTSKEVMLEFYVSRTGRPEKVKSMKSSVDGKYAAEAIRLIENGPDWVCEKDYPCKIKYSIYFK